MCFSANITLRRGVIWDLAQSAQKNRGLKHTLRCVIWVKSWKLEALIWAGSGVIFYKKFLCETSHLISCGRLSILIWTAGAEGRFEGLIITLGFIGTLTAPPLNIAIIWRCNLSRSFSSLRRHSSFSFSSHPFIPLQLHLSVMPSPFFLPLLLLLPSIFNLLSR